MQGLLKTKLNRVDFPAEPVHLAGLYWLFIDGIRLMASKYEEVTIVMPEFVDIPDEVIISFHDSVLYSSQLEEAGLINAAHTDLLKKIQAAIKIMPNENLTGEASSVMQEANWIKCRELARDLLVLLGEKLPEEYQN